MATNVPSAANGDTSKAEPADAQVSCKKEVEEDTGLTSSDYYWNSYAHFGKQHLLEAHLPLLF